MALGLHAYVVNKNSIGKVLDELQTERLRIEWEQPRDINTIIDQWMAKVLQTKLLFWGTEPLIVQDRNRFGSDTGCFTCDWPCSPTQRRHP